MFSCAKEAVLSATANRNTVVSFTSSPAIADDPHPLFRIGLRGRTKCRACCRGGYRQAIPCRRHRTRKYGPVGHLAALQQLVHRLHNPDREITLVVVIARPWGSVISRFRLLRDPLAGILHACIASLPSQSSLMSRHTSSRTTSCGRIRIHCEPGEAPSLPDVRRAVR